MDIENASIYNYGFGKKLSKPLPENSLIYDIFRDTKNPEIFDKTFGRGIVNVGQGALQSGNYVAGESGWNVASDGVGEFGYITFNKLTFTETWNGPNSWTKATGTGFTITERLLNLYYESGTTDNQEARYTALGSGTQIITDFSKNPGFIATISFNSDALSSYQAWITVGTARTEAFGFKLSGGIFSAYVYADATETLLTLPTSIDVTQTTHLKALMDSNLGRIRFYVNGKLEAEHYGKGTGFPTGTDPIFIELTGKTLSTTAGKVMRTHFVTFFQDK